MTLLYCLLVYVVFAYALGASWYLRLMRDAGRLAQTLPEGDSLVEGVNAFYSQRGFDEIYYEGFSVHPDTHKEMMEDIFESCTGRFWLSPFSVPLEFFLFLRRSWKNWCLDSMRQQSCVDVKDARIRELEAELSQYSEFLAHQIEAEKAKCQGPPTPG